MKINHLLVVLTLLFSFFFASNVNAKCRRVVKAKYQQQYGWSKLYTVEATFLTGMELNNATGTYNYTSYSVYAVIFWGQGQATVIKLSSYLMCGYEVTCSCINNALYDLQGQDQDGDNWNLCLSNYCF